MPVVDADSHVIESEHTWDYFDESEMRYKPIALSPVGEDGGRRYLSIDGQLRQINTGEIQGASVSNPQNAEMSGRARTTEAMRTMRDIEGRLRHMDELGVDVQVLYPTIYLGQITARPAVEAALSRSYNTWLADIWRQAEGRLRWVAVLPLLDMAESLAQLRKAKDTGACGVFMRGFEDERLLIDPYFFPLYEEAQNLDLPICVHAGAANRGYRGLVASEPFSGAKLPVVSSIHALLCHAIPDKFPKLRWGFIEASASWVPWVLIDVRRRLERAAPELIKENLLRDNHMYVTCQTNDDLENVLKYAGEDNLLIGTDYGHADTSSELGALKTLQEDTGLPPRIVKKIREDNPVALYGL